MAVSVFLGTPVAAAEGIEEDAMITAMLFVGAVAAAAGWLRVRHRRKAKAV